MRSVILIPLFLLSGFVTGCSTTPSLPPLSPADSAALVRDNLEHRAEVDSFFRFDAGSPFVRDTSVQYHGIKWFPVNPHFRGLSVLHRFADAETVLVMGTKGEERKQLRYGYFEFTVPGDEDVPVTIRLIAYKFTPYDGQRYALYRNVLSLWFTDKTTGHETYNVGRYVEIGDELPDKSHVYTIDLNKAFNP